jgi:hypothetical protein
MALSGTNQTYCYLSLRNGPLRPDIENAGGERAKSYNFGGQRPYRDASCVEWQGHGLIGHPGSQPLNAS